MKKKKLNDHMIPCHIVVYFFLNTNMMHKEIHQHVLYQTDIH